MRPARVGLPELPAGHGKALYAHGLRDLLLSKPCGAAQLLPHVRRRQDVVQ